ncbi:unnamed protein product [Lepeophtheirus salmonis]|uniref:(salmon louse) hypothetical protein n=1 Tax=Lepeophtheirus salmonis TaxID=72036 RepID=A0A7R8CQX4_LEPSM|nr:unnamed protein product [Lepeophtheirus salmonis]CAF2897538.1 unnamed protein product [Lepeophtheirus salmonis]
MLPLVSNKNQHVVYFNNFFTSHQHLTNPAEESIRTCCTVRDNRTGHCPLLSRKECKRKPRGTYDFRSDGTVVCVKWNLTQATIMECFPYKKLKEEFHMSKRKQLINCI